MDLSVLVIGIMTFVLSHVILNLILNPVNKFKEIIGEFQFWNLETSPRWTNSKITGTQTKELRKIAINLLTQMNLIPFYNLVSVFFGLPSKTDVIDASRYIIGLSMSTGVIVISSQTRMNIICELLKVYNAWDDKTFKLISMKKDL